jgi:hypothetical protein
VDSNGWTCERNIHLHPLRNLSTSAQINIVCTDRDFPIHFVLLDLPVFYDKGNWAALKQEIKKNIFKLSFSFRNSNHDVIWISHWH